MKTQCDPKNLLRQFYMRCLFICAICLVCMSRPVQTNGAASGVAGNKSFGWQLEYDAKGRVSSMTNAANKKTKFSYVQTNRGGLRSVTEQRPNGDKVKFSFDKYGQRTEMIDTEGTVGYCLRQ